MESKEKERSDPSRSAEQCQQNTYAQRSQQKLYPDPDPLQRHLLEIPKTWLTAEQVPPREKTLYWRQLQWENDLRREQRHEVLPAH